MTTPRLDHFSNGGLTFDLVDSGPLDGVPVVLLHGFPERASSWNEVSAHLHELGYRTFAPDQRGYSEGARPRGRVAYRMSKLVGDTVALIATIDAGPVHLVGHDWGATVAWSTAAEHSDLVRSLTTASVPHNAAFFRSMLSSRQVFLSYYMGLFQLPAVPELVFKRRPEAMKKRLMDSGMTEAMVRRFQSEIVDSGALSGALNWYRALYLAKPTTVLRKVAVPTTHVWSDGDKSLTRQGAELTERYVTGPYDLCVMTGVSHWIADEVPDELAAIIHARIQSTVTSDPEEL